MTPTPYFCACFLIGALAACPPAEEDPLGQGFTDCNGQTCQPGQYCFGGGICENGCLSDVNCAEGQDCQDEDDFDRAGVCVDADVPSEGEGEGEGPSEDGTCDSFADHAQDCGLPASDAAAIRASCNGLSADEQDALLACDAAESCDELRGCSGVECFSDDNCGSDAPHCLRSTEVVDPFTDIPFTCVDA